MPFVGKWSARIREDGQFDRIRTALDQFGEGIDVVWGIKDEETFALSIRFDSDTFDRSAVTKWLSEHDDSKTGKPYKALLIEAPLVEGSIGAEDSFMAISGSGPWTPVSSAETKDDVVHQRFRKELMSVGHYEQDGESGFDVSMKDLKNWEKVSKRMHKNGVRIPVTAGPVPHEDVGNPKNSVGTMEDAFIEGESLFVILDLVGEENIEKALANDVSIFSPAEFTDGKGRVYAQPITHVAITPTPLVPGLEGWEKIAASRKLRGQGREDLMFHALAEALGFDADMIVELEGMTAEQVEEQLVAKLIELLASREEEAASAKTKLEASTDDVKEKDQQLSTLRASINGKGKDPDPTLVGLTADNRKMKLNSLFDACRITPDVRNMIESRYGERNVIAASLKAGDSGDIFDFWVGVLSKNNPIELTEKTGAQVIKAALPDGNKDEKKGRKALLDNANKMRVAAGLEPIVD